MYPPVHERTSKYIEATRQALRNLRHATNGELLAVLHQEYPEVSATTVHRITARMLERGEVQLAPSGTGNVLRYDSNLQPHDHFMCTHCGAVRDAELGSAVRPLIEQALGGDCTISGSLTVSGLCKKCQ